MTELTSETRDQLKAISTATLMSCLFKRGLRNQFIQDVRPLNPNAGTMVGEAFTLRYMPAREDLNPMTVFQNPDHPQRKAVELCPPGAVLVMDSRKDARAASAGSILISRLMVRGAAGVVTDGGFRDSAEIARLAMPTFHSRPSAPTNLTLHQAIDINVPIGCGDAPVFPGDVIVGDADGVVVIPAHLAAEIAVEATGMTAFEDFVTEEVLKGRSIIGLYPATHEQDACRLRRLAPGQRPMTEGRNYIAGEWVAAAEASADINPSNTGDVLGQYPQASAADAERAIEAAQDAFPAWSRSTPQLRHDILKRVGDELLARKDEIGAILSREEGKPLAEGIGETVRAAQIFLFFSGEALRLTGDKLASVRPGVDIEITREPVGVVGMICPWNFPIAIPAWKTAPALAFGNCVVLKPAELVPATATALAEIIARAGVPPGVFNLVIGRGSVVGEAMLRHPGVNAITFTGSVGTGRRVAATCIASDPMKKVQLEMGGKNPLVVLDDADLANAVETAVNGAYFSTGQRCTASSRLIVTEGIHDRFVEGVTARLKALVIGDALAPETEIGPVVDQSQLDQDLRYVGIGKEEGAKLAFGGEQLKRATPGFYMAPALFVDVDPQMRIAREEIFGPVAGVIRAKDYDEALELANDTEFGLTAGICTTSLKHASHFRRNAEAGMVMVNLPTAGVDYHVPFGGRKGSSYGPREQGAYAKEFYTIVKTAYTFDLNGPYVPKTKASE